MESRGKTSKGNLMNEDLKSSVAIVGEAWKQSPYYEDAEKWTFHFWGDESTFKRHFQRLDLRTVVELACGHGRHAERVAPMAGTLELCDIHEENLAVCRKRLASFENVQYLKNSGFDFRPLPDASTTAIYCYDAMVHFSSDLVSSYLEDTARILVRGGMALYHHSNYDIDKGVHYGLNPHARNLMSMERFRNLSEAAGLRVVDSEVLEWGGCKDLDGLTLVCRD